MRETTSSSDTVYYFVADHLGSTSVTLNASGNKISEQKYYPFGETRSGSSPTDRQFTGQRAETGLGSLYDYNARMYSPVLGRFLSADSIVPGAADGSGGGAGTLGVDSSSRLTTLTTDFHEFIGQVTKENQAVLQYGPFFQWSEKVRKDNPVPSGPLNPQALNRYSYVLNNPLRYVDPTGHCPWCFITGLIGAAAGAIGSIVGQAISGQPIDAGEVVISAGVGFVAGFIAPVTLGEAIVVGVAANVAQYGAVQMYHNEPITGEGIAASMATGALGGVFAGTVPAATKLLHTASDALALAAGTGSRAAQAEIALTVGLNVGARIGPAVARSNFARAVGGGILQGGSSLFESLFPHQNVLFSNSQ